MKLVALAVLMVGCGGAGASGPSASTENATVSELTLGQGVSRIDATCFAEERCDALDSDCDGRIDESCEGAQSGALQLGLAWSGHANLHLEVHPAIEGAHTVEGCESLGPHFERRSATELVPGEYRVAVARGDGCEESEPTTASITIAVQGRVLGTFNVGVEEGSVEVARFSVTP